MEVELETEKSLREDAGWGIAGMEIRVAELEEELAELRRSSVAGEGTRREEENCVLAMEVEVLEREVAEIQEERRQEALREEEMGRLKLKNEEMKRRIADLVSRFVRSLIPENATFNEPLADLLPPSPFSQGEPLDFFQPGPSH